MGQIAQQDNVTLVIDYHEIDFDSAYFEEGGKEKTYRMR